MLLSFYIVVFEFKRHVEERPFLGLAIYCKDKAGQFIHQPCNTVAVLLLVNFNFLER